MGTEAGGLPLPRTKEEWEKSLGPLYIHAVPILYVATLESGSRHAMSRDATASLVEFLHVKGYKECFGGDGRLLLDEVVDDCLYVMDMTVSFDLQLERGYTKVRHAARVMKEFRKMFENLSIPASFEGLYDSLPMFAGAAHVLFNVLQATSHKERELIPRHEPFSLFADPSLYKTVARVDMSTLLEHTIQWHNASRGELPRFIVLPFRLIDTPRRIDGGNCTYSFSIVREPSAKRGRTDTTTLEVTTRRKGLK